MLAEEREFFLPLADQLKQPVPDHSALIEAE